MQADLDAGNLWKLLVKCNPPDFFSFFFFFFCSRPSMVNACTDSSKGLFSYVRGQHELSSVPSPDQ